MLVISAVSWDQQVPFGLETRAEWEFPQGAEPCKGKMRVDNGISRKKNSYY